MIVIKHLIVNADDFGLHEHINAGIIESHLRGCVTSTTIMAGGAAFNHAVNLAKRCPKLSVGVHLTLVELDPVARGHNDTLLTRHGSLLPNHREFTKKFFRGAIKKDHIAHELRCQMQKVVGCGLSISHIDSHRHLHVLPGMAGIIASIAREFSVSKIRLPSEAFWYFKAGRPAFTRVMTRSFITGCSYITDRQYKKAGFSSPQYFYGMSEGGRMLHSKLLTIIQSLPDGVSEIMVNPVTSNLALQKEFPWDYCWQKEMAVLTNKEVLDTIKLREIQLINFRELTNDKI